MSVKLHGWCVGSYVIMPDHVHFFCAPSSRPVALQDFVGRWKQWTGKAMKRELGFSTPVWQPGFFDHVLRSEESYAEKWEYVRHNPVGAGLVGGPEDWPYWGEIAALER